MSDSPDTRLSPLPADVTALFDAERRRPPADEAMVARMAAGIAARLDVPLPPPDGGAGAPPATGGDGGAGAAGAAGAGTAGAAGAPGAAASGVVGSGVAASGAGASGAGASGMAASGVAATAGLSAVLSPVTLVAFGLGVAAGAGGLAALGPSVPPAPVVIQAPLTTTEPSPAVVPALPSAPPVVADAHDIAGSQPAAHAAKAKRARPARPASAAERQLLEMARTALARGRSADALSALTDHRKRYRRSQLAEEREALTVIALARAGRGEAARAKAARFRRRFPRSLLSPSVEAVLR